MATITAGYSFGAVEEVTAAKLGQLASSVTGTMTVTNIQTADIADGAITNAKVSDVDGAKLTGLANIPAGSGTIPEANLADKFVDRGDPASADYTHATLTQDGSWHDLDLSAIVPSGTKAVLLRVGINDDAVASTAYFRKNGNTNSINIAYLTLPVANVPFYGDIVVACDTSRVIEYAFTNVVFTAITVTVSGYWL